MPSPTSSSTSPISSILVLVSGTRCLSRDRGRSETSECERTRFVRIAGVSRRAPTQPARLYPCPRFCRDEHVRKAAHRGLRWIGQLVDQRRVAHDTSADCCCCDRALLRRHRDALRTLAWSAVVVRHWKARNGAVGRATGVSRASFTRRLCRGFRKPAPAGGLLGWACCWNLCADYRRCCSVVEPSTGDPAWTRTRGATTPAIAGLGSAEAPSLSAE